MSSDTAISLSNIGKCYRIYDKPQDRLIQALTTRLNGMASPLLRMAGRTPRPHVYYREFWALRGVNLEIGRGETMGIIGLNGSGKSTLLQIIAGTLNPTEGAMAVNGRVAALLELGSGFNPEFTGRENVYLNGAILGLTRSEIEHRFDAIAAFADIGDFLDQPVKIYSSGMALRLAFAVIAHVDADVLLIDEALAVGDAVFSQKCMRFLRAFQQQGTVVFVSHDSGAVINLCDRAVWLQQGKAQMIADAKTVSEAYLESFYEKLQGASSSAAGQTSSSGSSKRAAQPPTPVDQRLRYINHSTARNDIELFAFDPNAASFGKGGAIIRSVRLLDEDGRPLSWIVGGENAIVRIEAEVRVPMNNPILGFSVKDRLGQVLFGENTYLTYRNAPIEVAPGEIIEASFAFRMPVLPVGDYTISAAIAAGTQATHVQHHWIHDALVFKSHTSSVSTGLLGIPMSLIEVRSFRSTYANNASEDRGHLLDQK